MSDQTLLIIAIGVLGAIFLMLVKCAFLLDRVAKAARRGTATLHINHPSALGLSGGGGGGGVARTPATSNAKVKITPGPHLLDAKQRAQFGVDQAEIRVNRERLRYDDAVREFNAAEARRDAIHDADTSTAEARENYAADKKLRDDEHATLKAFDPRLRLGDLTPEERADMSRKVAKIRVNTVLDARSTIATAIKTMPFEPEHVEALVKLHNALGVAVREFDASIKAAPSNAETAPVYTEAFGLQA